MRLTGDWEAWLGFFLRGVVEVADQAAAAARQLLELFAADRGRIAQIGRGTNRALRVHEHLSRHPIAAIPSTARDLGLSAPTVTSALLDLAQLGIVREITGQSRGRVFVYSQHLALMNEGTGDTVGTTEATRR